MTEQTTKPKPRRRWLQFSLRTFFVLLTLFCVWLGWTVHRANEQRKAVEWVREMGGTVFYDYEYYYQRGGDDFVDDYEPTAQKWLRDFLGDDYFQKVSGVYFAHTQVSDLTPLAKLTSLEYLVLADTQVSDLTPLTRLTRLQHLRLDDTPVRDLTTLAKLTSLQVLDLDNTQVSDLAPLAELQNLEWLNIRRTQVSDLTPLANLTSLQKLWLDNTPVSEEHVERLQQTLPNCEIVWSPPDPSP
ncbi:MAG: leucine-rich repeat domain-containing protein [Planctomycetes bacterium]|nr:leucine-rich repeat domain-containing protein [Planctomycetota bacterium]